MPKHSVVLLPCMRGREFVRDIATTTLFLPSDDLRLRTGHSFFVDGGRQ
ncbi:hypothetical protein [Luteitalea sp.]|nr:hypothetical protein [Luteitalea sp.]